MITEFHPESCIHWNSLSELYKHLKAVSITVDVNFTTATEQHPDLTSDSLQMEGVLAKLSANQFHQLMLYTKNESTALSDKRMIQNIEHKKPQFHNNKE